MTDDWPTQFTQIAQSKVDALIARHPEYTRDFVPQPGQGSTNRVCFLRRDEEIVVVKVFCETERKERECFALRHWQSTGLVPELIHDVDETTIVMSHIPGGWLGDSRKTEGEAIWRSACRETGHAIANLAMVAISVTDRDAFESRFYGNLPTLESYLRRILDLGRNVNKQDPDFQGMFWRNSLDFAEAQIPAILSQPAVLYHQDVGNLHVLKGRFMGFFDLEMCRIGCAAMQLGSSLSLLGGNQKGWQYFCEGWEIAIGEIIRPSDLEAALAVLHLLCWREITRYMSYDGTPGTGFDWATPADPARCHNLISAAEKMVAPG